MWNRNYKKLTLLTKYLFGSVICNDMIEDQGILLHFAFPFSSLKINLSLYKLLIMPNFYKTSRTKLQVSM